MKVIDTRLENITEPIRIIPLADLHIGDAHVDHKKIMDLINYIDSNDNVYCILDGDLLNNAVAGSKSDFYGETMKPSDQIKMCTKIFKPLAEKSKILMCLIGNHEERTYRQCGIDLVEVMCAELGISDLYSSTSTLLFLRFGKTQKHPEQKQCYTLYVSHGFGGGGRRVGSKLNSLEEMSKIVCDADCYIVGHSHQPAVFRQSTYVCDRKNSFARQHEQVFVNTASMLQWNGSYGDRMGFKPNSIHYPEIILDWKKHKVIVTL